MADIAKLGRKYETEVKNVQELYIKLLKRYAKLDEKGGFIPPKDKDGKDLAGLYDVDPLKMDEWKVAFEEFNSTEVELECHSVFLEDLGDVGLAPADLMVLHPILNENPKPSLATAPATPKVINPNTGAPALQ